MPKLTMPKLLSSYCDRTCLVVLLVVFLAPGLHAQQQEIPPAPSEESAVGDSVVDSPEPERIVDGRPRFYELGRALHPVAWLEGGMRPLLRSVEKIGFDKVASKDESRSVSGIKFGIKTLGASSGFGPEIKPFHKDVFHRGIEVELPLVVTYRLYESGRFRTSFPLWSDGDMKRLGLELIAGYASRPSENFFGIGNDSNVGSESQFRSVTRTAGVALQARTKGAWSARAEMDYRSIGITRPKKLGPEPRSAIDIFQGVDITGLTTSTGATMVSTTALIERDNRDDPHLTGSGGLQRLEASLNEGLTGGDFAYWRYRAEVQQFFPLTDDHRSVIGLRARVETTQAKGGSMVPFFDFPTIGGYSTVRGFSARRFTDASVANASMEYRYRIWRYFDWHLFADAGQVAPKIRNFAWERLHAGYGMGFIVRAAANRAMTLDVSHSRENFWMFDLDFGPLF